MKPHIFFVEDTSTIKPDVPKNTLVLYHKDYKLPDLLADTMSFMAFQERYKNEPQLLERDCIVFVGTNRIITPSSRTDPIFEILFSGTRHIEKISIDHVPFLNSDPWRIWFHFGITNTEYSIYDYSYAAETDYNKYLDEVSDYNPFSLEEMVKWSRKVVQVNYEKYFDWKITEVAVMPNVVTEYEDLKAELLETENGPKPVIQKLAKFAASWCPQRYIPQSHVAFRQRNVQIVKTNLKIDGYLTNELVSLMQLTNDYLWSLHNE